MVLDFQSSAGLACRHSENEIVEMVIGVYSATLPLQLSPQKEPFVCMLCISGICKVVTAERKAMEKPKGNGKER